MQFCTVFLEDLVPYLNRCLQLLFPPAQIAQTLGKRKALCLPCQSCDPQLKNSPSPVEEATFLPSM